MVYRTLVVLAVFALGCGPAVSDDSAAGEGSQSGGMSSAPATVMEGDGCEVGLDDAAAFLEEHGACTVDADCQLLNAHCYGGPERECTAVGANNDAPLVEWEAIMDEAEAACIEFCGGNECGAAVSCLEGRCTAVFP